MRRKGDSMEMVEKCVPGFLPSVWGLRFTNHFPPGPVLALPLPWARRLANLATKAGVEGQGSFRVHAPLLQLRKDEIIRRGLELGVDFSLTWSCYDPTPAGLACGACDSCQLRLEAFSQVGVTDPIAYARAV